MPAGFIVYKKKFAYLVIQNVPNKDSDLTTQVHVGLNPREAHVSKDMFSDVVAHVF